MRAEAALTLDTQGAALLNTDSGVTAGISAGGALTLSSGALDNRAGFIGAKGVELSATKLDNQGGQVHASDDLTLMLATDADNTGGLLRAGQTLSISALRLTNRDTQAAEQGVEGRSVQLTAQEIDNTRGALRADDQLLVTSAGSLDNSKGLVSAGQALHLRDAALAGSRTLRITNTEGRLIAGRDNQGQLDVDAAALGGDGELLSHGSLRLALDQAYTHSGKLLAEGDVTLDLRDALINRGKLLAGATLHVQAQRIDNQAAGDIAGGETRVVAAESLVNRGQIDGERVRIEAASVHNLGSGRIYGDHLAIQAETLTNDVEADKSATIAARERLDIGAAALVNREQALIFSAGALAIGGALDEAGTPAAAPGWCTTPARRSSRSATCASPRTSCATATSTSPTRWAAAASRGARSCTRWTGASTAAARCCSCATTRTDRANGCGSWPMRSSSSPIPPARPGAPSAKSTTSTCCCPPSAIPSTGSAPPAGSWRCPGPPTRRLASSDSATPWSTCRRATGTARRLRCGACSA